VLLLHEVLKPARMGEGGGTCGVGARTLGRSGPVHRRQPRQAERGAQQSRISDVASPSRGRTEDKAVAAWATHGGREGR
jgi:hypothetical protein